MPKSIVKPTLDTKAFAQYLIKRDLVQIYTIWINSPRKTFCLRIIETGQVLTYIIVLLFYSRYLFIYTRAKIRFVLHGGRTKVVKPSLLFLCANFKEL